MENIAEKDYLMSSLGEFFGDYSTTTIDEYFSILDKEAEKRSQMVAMSLTKYLKLSKTNSKYSKLIA